MGAKKRKQSDSCCARCTTACSFGDLYCDACFRKRGDFSNILLFTPDKGDKARHDLEATIAKAQRVAGVLDKIVQSSVVEEAKPVAAIVVQVQSKLDEISKLLDKDLARTLKRRKTKTISS